MWQQCPNPPRRQALPCLHPSLLVIPAGIRCFSLIQGSRTRCLIPNSPNPNPSVGAAATGSKRLGAPKPLGDAWLFEHHILDRDVSGCR